jgi:hypothetical protein
MMLFLLPLGFAALPGDVNGDGKVDMGDIMIVLRAFGTKPGYPRWDARCDLNADGQIDLSDVIIVLWNFGKSA